MDGDAPHRGNKNACRSSGVLIYRKSPEEARGNAILSGALMSVTAPLGSLLL